MNEVDIGNRRGGYGLDINARRNLELTETLRNKEKRGSLLWVLDRTKTAMGKRLIKAWLEQPLLSPAKITRRQNAVAELFENPQLLDQLTEQLTASRFGAHHDPDCVRLGQRPGASVSFCGGEAAAGVAEAFVGLSGHGCCCGCARRWMVWRTCPS